MSGLKGYVKILSFPNQYEEAKKIASIIRNLVDKKGIPENEIIILLRSNHNGNFSKPIIKELLAHDLTLNQENDDISLFEQDNGRYLLSLLKFLKNPQHDLAIRTILELTTGLGSATFNSIYELARVKNIRFHKAVELIMSGEIKDIVNYNKLITTLNSINELKNKLKDENIETVLELLKKFIPDYDEEFDNRLKTLIELNDIKNIDDLIEYSNDLLNPSLETPNENINGIRIMSMHQAKGLTAEAVFIVAAEDEYIPGRGDIDEERRLFYVSLTRAKHYLFISYCNDRLHKQSHTGFLEKKTTKRNLTRFLRDLPSVKPINGLKYKFDE